MTPDNGSPNQSTPPWLRAVDINSSGCERWIKQLGKEAAKLRESLPVTNHEILDDQHTVGKIDHNRPAKPKQRKHSTKRVT